MDEAPKTRLRIGLFPRAEAALRSGHPWVYATSIKSQNREGAAGELAVMYSRANRFLAIGMFDPDSPIRIRILHQGKAATIDREWWLGKARACLEKRQSSVLNAGTNGARMISGESEGFPGLVADVYGNTLVVKVYSESWLARWGEIEGVLREVFIPEFLVLRMSRNVAGKAAEYGLCEGFCGEVGSEVVEFSENGIHFEAAVLKGQKTGFFLDQRDNRARVEKLAAGRDVLNMFSFSGGFSLYAARGGARAVTDVDISAHALESARRNFLLNSGDPAIRAVDYTGNQADAFQWMGEAGSSYDLIIVDPPSLAKRAAEKEGALRAYRRLTAQAISQLRPGGILVAASCTAHVSAEEFYGLVIEEAQAARRAATELWRSGHAVDHPADFLEARYLKAICLELS